MNRRKFMIPAIFFAGLVWLAGCYPNTSKSTTDLDVVLTRYDEDETFADYKTYIIPDTVVQLGDPDDDSYIDLDLTQAEMDAIIGRIESNMAELGYIRVTNPVDTVPDAAIFVEVLGTQLTVVYSYPPGWGWGWGWYPGYPGWGGCCGWYYPPTIGGYSYPVGSLIVNFIDPDKVIEDNGDDLLYTPWVGVGNGLLSSSQSGERVTNAIDQMFDQSPYLRK